MGVVIKSRGGGQATAAAALVVLVAVAVAVQSQTAKAQTCTDQLTGLNVCAPFVVPGANSPQPSPNCCGALQSVQHDCLCSTLRIASELPTRCGLQTLACA